MQGYRDEMEDNEVIRLSLPRHPDTALIGIFDGHGGTSASSFLAHRLETIIDDLEDVFDEQSIIDAMIRLDAEFMKTQSHIHGSTSVWMVVRPNQENDTFKAAVANLGDSRIVCMDRSGEIKFVTQDHKPKLNTETARIVEAGGFVRGDRVDGQLAVARAIGDSNYKNNGLLQPHQQKVSCVPDISFLEFSSKDVVLVACDGLFERLATEDLAQIVARDMEQTLRDPASICCKLMDASLLAGSRDNMSSILVTFVNGEDYTSGNEFVAGPFYQWSDDTRFRKAYELDAHKHGVFGKELIEKALNASIVEVERIVGELETNSQGDEFRLLELNAMRKKLIKEINEAYEADIKSL